MNKSLLRTGGLLICLGTSAVCAAAATDEQAKHCEIHAATMVAEMRASAAKAMSADEITLVRQTAYKSCLAQTVQAQPAVAATPATGQGVQAAAPAATAPARAAKREDDTFWGSLHSFLGTEPSSKAGNVRLRERSGM